MEDRNEKINRGRALFCKKHDCTIEAALSIEDAVDAVSSLTKSETFYLGIATGFDYCSSEAKE